MYEVWAFPIAAVDPVGGGGLPPPQLHWILKTKQQKRNHQLVKALIF